MRKHDWLRYADGTPRLNKRGGLECKRCGSTFYGFIFEEIDQGECPQLEIDGLKELSSKEAGNG